MKLWILRPVDGLNAGENPWNPWYDKVFGFVIRAETEEAARAFAHADAADENRGEFLGKPIASTQAPWLDSKYSTCIELSADGEAGVLMQNFAGA